MRYWVCQLASELSTKQFPLDCTQDECVFENETHPLVYSALNSHASYPIESDNIIYNAFSPAINIVIDEVLLVDRTMLSNRSFFPTLSNVLPLPTIGNIPNGSTDIWAAWEAPWVAPRDNQFDSILCFQDNCTLKGMFC